MTPANDNGPIKADDFTDLAARRAWLASAPATHAAHREVSPVETWAKRKEIKKPSSASGYGAPSTSRRA